jgi:hypothetical protein
VEGVPRHPPPAGGSGRGRRLRAADRHPGRSATASASSTPTADVSSPIEAILPTHLGGVELHTFAVGQDILLRLADQMGVGADAFEVAYASEHGARFLQMFAVRLDGTDAEELAAAWAGAAYPAEVTDAAVSEEGIDGMVIAVVDAPSARTRLGTFYLHPVDETLFVVQSFDRDVATEAM